MVRLWNRLLSMPDDRITKQVFVWEYELNSRNWAQDMLKLFTEIDLQEMFYSMETCNIAFVKEKLRSFHGNNWEINVKEKPKLKTYVTFKKHYGLENYLTYNLSRGKRSLLAQFRLGILPLKVETGRFSNIDREERICDFCKNEVEDEVHFLFHCGLYREFRELLFTKAREISPHFDTRGVDENLEFLMTTMPLDLANFVSNAFCKRKEFMYNV